MAREQTSVSVLIAIPHFLTRELLVGALRRYGGFRVIDGATTSDEVLKAVQSSHVDVALINATLAEGPLSGLGALRQIRESHPAVRSVILHDGHQGNLVVDAFRAGAKGVFCLSESTFKALCRCVQRVHEGQIWASSGELSEVMEAFHDLAPIRVVNADGMRLLTNREEEVVRLLAEGLQNREIANELKLSEHTIKNYLFHIFDKLGVSSRVELVLYAISSTKRAQTTDNQGSGVESESAGCTELEESLLTDAVTANSLQPGRKRPVA